MKIEKEFGITVAHETHRRRIFYNPWDTRDLITKVESIFHDEFIFQFPDLKITADLSHWFCVLSNDLDGEMDVISKVAERFHEEILF